MLEGHGTSYGGERGKEKEDPVGIWKRLLLVPSRFTLASRTNDTRRDVRLENFHLLLSSPPRWQECVGPRRGNLCLISISDIENSLDESQFRELPRFRANKEPNNKREERVTGLEVFAMKDISFLPMSFFTRYISRDVQLFHQGKILFRCSIARTLNNTRMGWIFSLGRKLYGNSVDRSTSISK